MPIYGSVSLEKTHAALTHAVIWIHGLSGDANSYFCTGMAAVQAHAGATQSTLSIAPWFGNEQVTREQWVSANQSSANESDDVSAYWSSSRWLTGGNNSPSPARYTTSFDALDAIFEALVSLKVSGRLPSLNVVSLKSGMLVCEMGIRWDPAKEFLRDMLHK